MHQRESFPILSLSFLLLILCGCGGVQVNSTNPLEITPSTISFGSVAVGQSATTNVSVLNRGLTTVQVTQMDITGGSFSILGQSFPISIAPGAKFNFTATFAPTAVGTTSGQIDVVLTDVKKAVALSGTGTAAQGPVLIFNSRNIAFGSTALNTPVTQSLVINSVGTVPVSVTSATSAGAGFSLVGATLPVTLDPGQSATLNVVFNPTALGSATGQLSINSTASAGPTTAIGLSGTGVAFEVQLTWNAPADTADPVSGYKIYRSTGGSSTYQLMNSSVVTGTSFADATVESGMVYDYIVESVDAAGAVSAPSNSTTVTIP